MNVTLEQYHGSLVKYILSKAASGTVAYFGKMPEDFAVPSIYFLMPRTQSAKGALGKWYRTTFHFECYFFGVDDWSAYEAAAGIRTKMLEDGCIIQCYEKDGTDTKYAFRTGFPELSKVDDGVVSLKLDFDHVISNEDQNVTKISELDLTMSGKKPEPEETE